MQDLSEKVQAIASSFYQTRSDRSFTDLYKILLPEAKRMLRAFIKDSQTVEDISSKIFESILTKPSIYFDDSAQQNFIMIAASYIGIDCKHCKHFLYRTPDNKVKSYYKSIINESKTISYTDVGKLWLLIFKSEVHKLYKRDENGELINLEKDKSKPPRHAEIKVNLKCLNTFDLSRLSDIQAPFIFDLNKPFLHYYSRIIKTNALSHIKKQKNLQDQYFSDMYSGYDDDDKPQLISNQLTSEPETIEKERSEHQDRLCKQKMMIIFDIIQNTVPENQRGIIIDAILNKMDYKQIASKYNLETVGCIKSRVHRFKKLLDQETLKTPHFTSQVTLGVYQTFYSNGQVRMSVDVCEPTDDGITHSLWHGQYVEYYSTGEVKMMGRYSFNKRHGDWYQFYKDGAIMKRGKYHNGKHDGVWHHFDHDGKLNSKINHLTGYYEIHHENGDIVSGIKDSDILPVRERKTSPDETIAAKLCIQYDSEFSYPSLHFKIS